MTNKILCLAFLACFYYTASFAQATIGKQRTIGGNKDDYFGCMDLTKDGGLISGGSSYSNRSGQKREDGRGGLDYWVVKHDSTGHIQWDKTIGGSGDDKLNSLQQTSDGGYILGGRSNSNRSGDKTEDNRAFPFYDMWIVKLDSLGNVQWDKTIGGSGGDACTSVQQTSDGGYIVGGPSNSGISGDKSQDNRGPFPTGDFWIIKLNSKGKIEWDKTIGGSGNDNLQTVEQTAGGGYVLAGFSNSNTSGEKTQDSHGLNDYWVVKISNRGEIRWDKTMGGSADDIGVLIQQTNDEGYIVGGYSFSNRSGDKTQNSRGAGDYWVLKLNKTGNIKWDKTVGGDSSEELNSLEQTSDGGYILGGLSRSNVSREKTENSRGGADYWAVKLDDKGQIEWDKTIGGSNDDILINIREAKFDNHSKIERDHYVLGGYSYSGISGDETQDSIGGSDYWLLLLNYKNSGAAAAMNVQSTAILNKSDLNSSNSLTVYPNPAKDVLHVQVNGKAIVFLINQSGLVLLNKTINGNDVINVSRFAKGIYYLKNNTTGTTEKIVIE